MAAQEKICFDEQIQLCDGKAEDVIVTITVEEAVARQRASCVKARGVDLYTSDDEALEDFMVVHFAWFVQDEVSE